MTNDIPALEAGLLQLLDETIRWLHGHIDDPMAPLQFDERQEIPRNESTLVGITAARESRRHWSSDDQP